MCPPSVESSSKSFRLTCAKATQEEWRVACWSPVLAQRAVADSPRWPRAVGFQTGDPPVKRRHTSVDKTNPLPYK